MSETIEEGLQGKPEARKNPSFEAHKIKPGEVRNPKAIGSSEGGKISALLRAIGDHLFSQVPEDLDKELAELYPAFSGFDEHLKHLARRTFLQKAIATVTTNAANGDLDALKWLVDRYFGSVTQKQETISRVELGPAVDISKLSPEERAIAEKMFLGHGIES